MPASPRDHYFFEAVPVEPNPPVARSVASRLRVSTNLRVLDRRDDHLRDAHAAANDERLAAEIDKNDL